MTHIKNAQLLLISFLLISVASTYAQSTTSSTPNTNNTNLAGIMDNTATLENQEKNALSTQEKAATQNMNQQISPTEQTAKETQQGAQPRKDRAAATAEKAGTASETSHPQPEPHASRR